MTKQAKTKTDAVKILLKKGWTWEEIKAVLEDSDETKTVLAPVWWPYPYPVYFERPRPRPWNEWQECPTYGIEITSSGSNSNWTSVAQSDGISVAINDTAEGAG